MAALRISDPDKGISALGAAALTGLLGYALAMGFGIAPRPVQHDDLRLFNLAELPPPPQPKPVPKKTARKHQGAAAPPNLRSTATQVVAPPPVVPIIVPPRVVAAPVADMGADHSQGAANVSGPGTGAGGIGNGRGSGGSGDGDGYGEDTPPCQIRGRLKDSDYPRGAAETGTGGKVSVRFTVWTDGRVINCQVTHSSGNREIDDTTCRLIQQRYRFRPSLDPGGNPIPSIVIENHEWVPLHEPATD